jgi:hypothetical protein
VRFDLRRGGGGGEGMAFITDSAQKDRMVSKL